MNHSKTLQIKYTDDLGNENLEYDFEIPDNVTSITSIYLTTWKSERRIIPIKNENEKIKTKNNKT